MRNCIKVIACSVFLAVSLISSISESIQTVYAEGYVFLDLNRNRKMDPGEKGIPGIRVSNRRDIVLTNQQGKWRLPVLGRDTIFFVIKPKNYMTPVDDKKIPRFYYIHKPDGSPKLRYPGVQPTGELPKQINFPLYPQKEPEKFQALFFGDTQPRDIREIEYIAHDVVEDLIGSKAAFGVTLGDIVFDDLSLFEPLARTIALIGIPWYNVLGNHDENYDAKDDSDSDETFESFFGPSYYSFDYGPTHFVVLDDVVWHGAIPEENKRGFYTAGLGKTQLEWLRKDLSLCPPQQLVVLMMHIPMTEIEDRQELYRIIEKRPYVISISAHTHYQRHVFLTNKDGWRGAKPHHHVVNVTVCGSWWSGSPNELGIPHTTMRCGAPNGYSIFTFNRNQYSIEFRAAKSPHHYQMNIYAPETVSSSELSKTFVQVNVFGGSEKSRVEMKVGVNGSWKQMNKVEKPDPFYSKAYERDRLLKAPFYPLPAPINSPHLWEATLPTNLRKGMHPIFVRTKDMFGQTYTAVRSIRVD